MHWNETEFWKQFEADPKSRGYKRIAEEIMQWAKDRNAIYWPKITDEANLASFRGQITWKGNDHRMFQVWGWQGGSGAGTKSFEILFQWMDSPFEKGSMLRRGLRQKLEQIPGLILPPEGTKGSQRPNFSFELLVAPSSLAKFFNTFDWMISEIKKR